ncbi:MAG: ECF transporter S component [Eubacterium sp.]
MKTNSKSLTRKITICAMLSAIGIILQFVEVSVPVVPSFIKLDFSDLPGFIGAIVCGPVAGVVITLIRNVVHIATGSSAGIGELSNFVLSASFVLTAGLIYKKMPSIKGVAIGGIVGAIVMGIVSLPFNNFVIYPLYYSVMGLPKEAILDMYQVIRPSTESIEEALLVFNVPFTIVKGLISVVFTCIIYKPLEKLIKTNINV